ncbi:MAG: UDP-N-acetylglucosamine 2-epimerase (non-hydrolyzing) [Candidatus Aenigmarchaeota archaeon]|nr:UDP-N-acetylglucosamine 2-epimerase (non-hydrolyzing) [Candidatus Aenigmarchaeota archaeon]
MKVVTVFGTRPEIIKLSPVTPLMDKKFEHVIIHTGQHYNYEMDKIFFDELELRNPDYSLNVGSDTHAVQTAKMMVGIEKILMDYKPDIVNVFADPNTPLAGALAAAKLNIPVVHIEAGCRSFNKKMPEEINRILVDHCSELLLASDKTAVNNMISEGIHEKNIRLVGSTIVDAVNRNIKLARKTGVLKNLGLKAGAYIVLTLHRAENTDNAEVLNGIIKAINHLSKKIAVVFPVHPRTQKILGRALKISDSVKRIEPLGYLEFLQLISNAKFIITDSGGIQEEADAVDVPCVIARNETEWVELVDAGRNILASTDTEKIIGVSETLLNDESRLNEIKKIGSVRKAGASQKIVGEIEEYFGGSKK